MSINKTEALAEHKLITKVIDNTKKIVNIVAISSYIMGILCCNIMFSITEGTGNGGGNAGNIRLLAFASFTVFFLLLLWVVNKGLNKYKE